MAFSRVTSKTGPRLVGKGERMMRWSASQFGASGSAPMNMFAKRRARSTFSGISGSARPKP